MHFQGRFLSLQTGCRNVEYFIERFSKNASSALPSIPFLSSLLSPDRLAYRFVVEPVVERAPDARDKSFISDKLSLKQEAVNLAVLGFS